MKSKCIYLLLLFFYYIQTANAQWVPTSVDTAYCSSIVYNDSSIFAGISHNNQVNGYVLKSTDHGNSWTEVFNTNYMLWVAISDYSLFALTYDYEGMFKSTDNGLNWSPIAGSPGGNTIATDGLNLYVGMPMIGLDYSNDNGITWNDANMNMNTVLSSTTWKGYAFIGTHYSGLNFSPDSGATWITKGFPTHDISVLGGNDSMVYAGIMYGGIYCSVDTGSTWNLISSISKPKSFAFKNNYVFAGTNGSGIYLSNDYGSSWTTINDGLTNLTVLSIAIVDSTVFIGTDGAGIWKRELSDILSSTHEIEKLSSVNLYPNPTSDNIKIEADNIEKVSISNIKGNTIFTSIKKCSSLYINVQDFPKGVYFVEIDTNKEVYVKKFIIK